MGSSEPGTRPSWQSRLAAIAALLAPVAMAVLLAIALIESVGIAVLAVALVLLASAAIWVGLTRRGIERAGGVAAAVLCAAGLVVVLATHWQGLVVLIAALLLLALFGIAARYALHGTRESVAREAAAALLPVGAASSAVLIINLKSGGGKAERFELVERARELGVTPIVLQPGDDLRELA
jgi:hypothetical protein